tara:strand:- start:678 stop:1052 length:375 start_codon:yes stop_codon:yes gene_type:complete
MIIYQRRPEGNQSLRLDRNKSYAMYSDWKAQRQAAMDVRDFGTQMRDDIYQERNMNSGYYEGLNTRISERQATKMPIAGEGAVSFFGDLTTVLRFGSKVAPQLVPLYLLSRLTEEVAKEKSGLR